MSGARVMVTGGAANIGRGIVRGFVAEGARVMIADRDRDQLDRTAEDLYASGVPTDRILLSDADLVEPGAAVAVVAAMEDAWGGVDALVNNAGWSVPNFLLKDTDRSRWQRLVDVNLFATIECTQAVLPLMQRQGRGSIVMIASDAAFGQLRQGVYGATKAAQVALARTVAKEFGRDGVRCNVVCPGLVVPESAEEIGAESLWSGAEIFDEAQVASIEKSLPLRRLTSATDIADTVVFLSSELRSRQTTGQILSVSGGFVMP
ncbi:SDR family NAD(P)-dependent oxidoreductase [Granulicoccus phenolivorans]|uniref:SDR family NAD(P)-dependent oxidoreductase n=1 Tax=Granulicoccus phenolivorans TaxID=266854 RepID=UPI001C3F2837|nr:SDR family oxidoreductase [Granulicoccus phenolivorans]